MKLTKAELDKVCDEMSVKEYERIGVLYPRNKHGRQLIYASYIDSKGEPQERLTKGIGYPKGATKALAKLRTYEHPLDPTPDVLAILGAQYD